MGNININNYIHTPATIFDLNGRCWYSDKDQGTPCRIKVGPRRFLNEHVHPDQLRVTIWQCKDGQITYLPNEPVETSVDKNGHLTIDMVALAKKYFGEDISFCSSDWWKWKKDRPWSDTFLATDYGVAGSRSTWLDINVTHSTLYFKPGTLTLEGHDVLSIYWETFCDELGAHSATMRPFAETLLDGPHAITAEDFKRPLENLELLEEYGFNHLKIRTDRGDYDLCVGLGKYIAVSLKDEGIVPIEHKPSGRLKSIDAVDLLLQLMKASNGDEVRAKVQTMYQQGIVTKAAPKKSKRR